MATSQEQSRARAAFRRRLGFTLLEIMTSVTLALMLMYAVARIFSRVGGTMNETTSVMEATNSLRNAKNRLTADLEAITVNPVPPRNSRLNDGYLCYVEGLGAPLDRLYGNGAVVNYGNRPNLFSTEMLALDAERFAAYGIDEIDANGQRLAADSSVGDTDDILSFTAKAPAGKPFKGRYVRPKRNVDGEIYSGEVAVFESEFAEIVWFVRGTTLYRRVLPILPNDEFQDSLLAFKLASKGGEDGADPDNSIASLLIPADEATAIADYGFGFFRYYDVSVHMNSAGGLVANTLGDLTNRANRFGYWSTVGRGVIDASNPLYEPFSIHGFVKANLLSTEARNLNNPWYWLRMPTMQESVQSGFRAGAPFGQSRFARHHNNAANFNLLAGTWGGLDQPLTFSFEGSADSPLPTGVYPAQALPLGDATSPVPFIDFWNNANIWDQVNSETGDVATSMVGDEVWNQDVVLTNVLSFNVKAWDDHVNSYVDLGCELNQNHIQLDDPSDLRSGGYYLVNRLSNNNGSNLTTTPMPCVYDTWTEQYQRDLYVYDEYSGNPPYADANGSMSMIPSDAEIAPTQLLDYPPPYSVPLKSLQIEIRVFDPRSKQIRNATFIVDLEKH